jgi:cell wall-associated NlpC family hydrolase
MPSCPPSSRTLRHPPAPRTLAALAVAVLLLAAPTAQAAPEGAAPGDAVLNLLHEKGLIPKGPAALAAEVQAHPVVQQVRDAASDLVISAMNFLGVRYKRGGDSAEEGFDCSGFTRHVFENSLGLVLPRRSDQQARFAGLLEVRREELKPGDLVFFNTMRRAFSHVGIYIGDGKFIHAPRTGSAVRVEDMRMSYWTRRYDGARRAALPADATATATSANSATSAAAPGLAATPAALPSLGGDPAAPRY